MRLSSGAQPPLSTAGYWRRESRVVNTFIRPHKDSFTKIATWEGDFFRNSTHSPSPILLGTKLWDLPNKTLKQVYSFNNRLSGNCRCWVPVCPGYQNSKIPSGGENAPSLQNKGKPGRSELCLRESEEFSRQRPQYTAREWGRACCVQGTANRPVQIQRGELEVGKNEVELTGELRSRWEVWISFSGSRELGGI